MRPGSFMEFALIWIVMAIPVDELYLIPPHGTTQVLNVIFYSTALFLVLTLIQKMRWQK